MTPSARPPALVCATVAVMAIAGCTGSHKTNKTDAPSTTAAASSASSAKSPPPPARKAVNPLTGIGPVPRTPVIAVKIDDTPPGRPQLGIDKADVVYIEEAEGGLTRLAAVFGTHLPLVGYVRSTRPSDPDLLLQYGRITEAASGGGHDALPLLDRSGIKGWINDRGAPFYTRVSRSQSSYINLALNLSKVAKRTKTPRPHSIGWTWNASTSSFGVSTKATDVKTRVGSQVVEFRYNAPTKKYVRYINGVRQLAADRHPIATSNVIVQTCKIVPHPQDTDVNGNPSQFTFTTGTGRVSVFRNGRRIDGTWRRGSLLGGTTLRNAAGKVIPLNPGGAWVVLVRPRVATIS